MGELRVEGLSKTYGRREGWNKTRYLRVFDDISFTVRDGEFVSIIGSSGCGKSTLLSIAGGLAEASGGSIHLDGRPVRGPGLDRGIVFQEFALFPWLTVLGNIKFGLKSKGVAGADQERLARKYVDLVGLSGFEDYHPYRLSGGMRQRVGLARALAIEPAALLMDEPFGALDAQTREAMQGALSDIWVKTRSTGAVHHPRHPRGDLSLRPHSGALGPAGAADARIDGRSAAAAAAARSGVSGIRGQARKRARRRGGREQTCGVSRSVILRRLRAAKPSKDDGHGMRLDHPSRPACGRHLRVTGIVCKAVLPRRLGRKWKW